MIRLTSTTSPSSMDTLGPETPVNSSSGGREKEVVVEAAEVEEEEEEEDGAVGEEAIRLWPPWAVWEVGEGRTRPLEAVGCCKGSGQLVIHSVNANFESAYN